MAKRKATYVQLHDVFHIPGAGQFNKVLPDQAKTVPGLKMTYVEETGCVILCADAWQFDFVLTAASIKGVKLEREVEQKTVATKPAAKKEEPKSA